MTAVPPKLRKLSVLADRYKIVELIGRGGMGNVYLAEDLKLPGKQWAVKEIVHRGDSRLFAREAELLTKLHHPNLPTLVDYAAPDRDGYCYLVMEYVQGDTLADVFARSGCRLSLNRVLQIGVQLCDILIYLHHELPVPIVYRDLKPSNIMLGRGGHLKLIDFGIARFLGDERAFGEHASPSIASGRPSAEAPSARMGTPGFAAPEQYDGHTDPRTDLYNLGALLYHLLSGGKHASEGRVHSGFPPGTPTAVKNIVVKLLAAHPQKRYADAETVKRQLVQALEALSETEKRSRRNAAGPVHLAAAAGEAENAAFSRLIVVGGLYPGCGSTFAAFSLAFAFQSLRVRTALIEFPKASPSHYRLLDRGNPDDPDTAPPRLLSDCLFGAGRAEPFRTFGHLGCYPADPHGAGSEAWREDAAAKLRERIRADVLIVDVSSLWDEPSSRALCDAADHLIAVADHNRAGWNLAATMRRVRLLTRWESEGKTVDYIGNRDVAFRGRKEWLASFPRMPSATIPYVPYSVVVENDWKGRLIQENARFMRHLRERLQPLLAKYMRGVIADKRKPYGRWMRAFRAGD